MVPTPFEVNLKFTFLSYKKKRFIIFYKENTLTEYNVGQDDKNTKGVWDGNDRPVPY